MAVERHKITSTEQWLAWRRGDVTASVAACLLGADVHEYVTPFELWAMKTGTLPDIEESPAMRRGRLLEPVALEALAEDRPRWHIYRPGLYLRDPAIRLGATPDAYVIDHDDPDTETMAREDGNYQRAPFGVVQVKSVNPWTFKSKWRQDDGSIEPPLWIVIQAIVEAKLAGAQWAKVAALVVGHGIDLHLVDVPLHIGVYDRIAAEVTKFWAMVDAGQTPPVDYGRDADTIKMLYRTDDGTHVDLRGNVQVSALAEMRTSLSSVIKKSEKSLKEVNAELLMKIGHATTAEFDGGTMTAKTVNRKEYVVKAGSYRALKIKLDNPVENDDD